MNEGSRYQRNDATPSPAKRHHFITSGRCMHTRNIKVQLRDGVMDAHVAYPDRVPAGAIVAIMEIWGVNDTMRRHAREFAEAGFVCLVPDLFWRLEPGVELHDSRPEDVRK